MTVEEERREMRGIDRRRGEEEKERSWEERGEKGDERSWEERVEEGR